MIRFGPAGIPLSCKGRTLKDGIEDVHNLGLTALEIPMVRGNTIETYPDEGDIGVALKDVQCGLVVEIIRDDEQICDPNVIIEDEDVLVCMSSGLTDTYAELIPIGDMAKRMDVKSSLHTPYYMDLGSNSELTEKCMNSIRYSGVIANAMMGDIVVTSLGLYNGSASESEIEQNIHENLDMIVEWWKDMKIKPHLGIEITGRQETFGSLDQVLDLCKGSKILQPVINFPHYHARTKGSLVNATDFSDLLTQIEPYCHKSIYSLFAGVEHAEGNEKRLTPIKRGDLKFEPLAEALVELKPEMTIISGSPLLEHDAMYMKVIHERVLTKKVAKAIRLRKKDENAAIADQEE